jgi:integrase
MALTVKRVERLTKAGRYRDEKNLFLQITQAGVKSWLLRYVSPVTGKERWMGLGPADDIDLDEARDKAKEARRKIRDGDDPLEVKRADRALKAAKGKPLTFEEACRAYHEQNEARWENAKSRKQWLSKMKRFAFPIIGRVPIASVDTALALRVLEQPYEHIDREGKKQIAPLWIGLQSAARLRQGLEQVLSWAKVRGHRSGDNPATLDLLQHALPARPKNGNGGEHHPSLPFAQIGEFMGELSGREGVAARALEFTILTAARAGEVLGARWDEIDLAARTWTVPAERIKGGREHKVPLTKAAIAILENLPTETDNPFCFIGTQRGDHLGKAALATVILCINEKRQKAGLTRFVDPKEAKRRAGPENPTPPPIDIVVHGFRSSFRDWVGEATSFPETLAEAALAHIKGDKVENAYARGTMFDKRRKLMDAWSKYAAGSTQRTGENVVVLRPGAA